MVTGTNVPDGPKSGHLYMSVNSARTNGKANKIKLINFIVYFVKISIRQIGRKNDSFMK